MKLTCLLLFLSVFVSEMKCQKSLPLQDTSKISLLGKRAFYKTEKISNEVFFKLLDNYQVKTTRAVMLSEYEQMRRYKRNRIGLRVLGLSVYGIGGFMMMVMKSLGDSDGNVTGIGGGYFIIGAVPISFSFLSDKKYKQRKRRIVEMYNAFE